MSDRGGPFSPPPDGPFAGLTMGKMLLMGLGVLMLLPGACSLFFAVVLTAEKQGNPFSDPYVMAFLPVMIIGLLIGAGGVAVIIAVRRRARRPN